jgi:hypothetical protein
MIKEILLNGFRQPLWQQAFISGCTFAFNNFSSTFFSSKIVQDI